MDDWTRIPVCGTYAVPAVAVGKSYATETGGAVYLHDNSIRYRFRLIQRETGLNPRNFYDLEKLLAMIDKQGT